MLWQFEIFFIWILCSICTFCLGTIEDLRTNTVIAGDCSSIAESGYIITVEFETSLEDGTIIYSTQDDGIPFELVLGSPDVQESWNTELFGVCLRETRRIEVPSRILAPDKLPSVPSNTDVIFDINVIQIEASSTTKSKQNTQVITSASWTTSKLPNTSGFSTKSNPQTRVVYHITNKALPKSMSTAILQTTTNAQKLATTANSPAAAKLTTMKPSTKKFLTTLSSTTRPETTSIPSLVAKSTAANQTTTSLFTTLSPTTTKLTAAKLLTSLFPTTLSPQAIIVAEATTSITNELSTSKHLTTTEKLATTTQTTNPTTTPTVTPPKLPTTTTQTTELPTTTAQTTELPTTTTQTKELPTSRATNTPLHTTMAQTTELLTTVAITTDISTTTAITTKLPTTTAQTIELPTTTVQTTELPTTTVQTTELPTTTVQTTELPTTTVQTTELLTTTFQTTELPTTTSTTTELPTTTTQTTEQPTNTVQTTELPTTTVQTTKLPTTTVQTTELPTTTVQTTETLTTTALTTEQPFTTASTTKLPTSIIPTTEITTTTATATELPTASLSKFPSTAAPTTDSVLTTVQTTQYLTINTTNEIPFVPLKTFTKKTKLQEHPLSTSDVLTTLFPFTSQVKRSAITSDTEGFSSKLLTTLVTGSSLTSSNPIDIGGWAKLESKTKLFPKNQGKSVTTNPELSKSTTIGKRILNPDENVDDSHITPRVLRSPPVMSTHRKIATRSVSDGEGVPDAVPSQPTPKAESTKKSIIDSGEYVTEYYMEEITVTVSSDDEDDIIDGQEGVSKVKDSGDKNEKGPKVKQKHKGKIYYHMQYIAVPVAIILFCLVAYCLYTVEFPDRKVKFYRVRDHDPVLDGPL